MLGRVLRVAGWTLVTGVVVLVAVYLTALAINREDRPPSSEALEMAASLDAMPEVADEDNAYVYMLGFAAPRDADPRRVGGERADWIRRLRTDHGLSRDSDPYSASLGTVWDPEPKDFFRECPHDTRQRECFAMLRDAGAELGAWLAEQDWVLERYETLLSYPRWREIRTLDHRSPYPSFSNVSLARRAWFLEAWSRANRGDAPGVREVLGDELEFWRLVLAESHSLLMKMIAASHIKDHFERSNLILKRLPAERVARAVPASWRKPLSAAERSLRRVLAFELRFARNHLESLGSTTEHHSGWVDIEPEPPSFMQRLDNSSAGAFIQTQDFLNKRARAHSLIADAVEEPYERIPAALERAASAQARETGHNAWHEGLYNFVGDILREMDAGAYEDYAPRVSDIEGVRRAALLAAELRSRGIAPSGVEAELANAELTNPYTGEPFTWDAESGGIVFDGIARRRDGRHVFWY